MSEESAVMWQEWLWCVLQFVGPMFLRYFPFRKKLRIPLWALAVIVASVWGGIALSLVLFGYSPDYSMNLYCSIAILIFFPLSCVIIKDRFVKHFFVYLMSYNLMTVSIGISQFLMERLGGGLMTANLATLLFYPFTYPFLFRFLRRELEPVMDVIDTPPDLPAIYGDRERLLQVLLNLVSNSVRHTVGGTVTLSARSEGKEMAVMVRDTGEGIAPELLSNLFQRYPRNRAAGGNGLGLYICGQIVEAHGGKISVESKVGEGTKVRFTIPAVKREVAK